MLRLFPLLLLLTPENALRKKVFLLTFHMAIYAYVRSSSLKIYEFQTRFYFLAFITITIRILVYRYATIITFNWKSNRISSESVYSRARKMLPFIYFRKKTLISNGYPTKRFIRILKKRLIFI